MKNFKYFITIFIFSLLFQQKVFAICESQNNEDSIEILFPKNMKYDIEKLSKYSSCVLDKKLQQIVCGYRSGIDNNFAIFISEDESIDSGNSEFVLSEGFSLNIRIEPIDKKHEGIETIFIQELKALNKAGIIQISDINYEDLFSKILVGNSGYNKRLIFINGEWNSYKNFNFPLIENDLCATPANSSNFLDKDGKISVEISKSNLYQTSTQEIKTENSSENKENKNFNLIYILIIISLLTSISLFVFLYLAKKRKNS